jgi:Protein of unknown function (DUF2744)
MALPDDFRKFPHAFPTRENCDPTNPYQAFLWMLVAMPYMKGAQLVLPVDYLQFVSKRLWDCGVRPVEDPAVKYRPPLNTDANWLTSPGSWVDVDTPEQDPRRPVEKAVDELLTQQQAELVEELYRRMSPKQRKMLHDKVSDQ